MISRHIGRILPDLRGNQEVDIYRDFLKARGGEYISYKMELQPGFMSQSDPGFTVQTCAQACSKFLVLKSKIEFKM